MIQKLIELDLVSDAYDKWLVQDQLLFTWLLSTLSDSVLPRVIGCKHSWQVWEAIHKYFYSHLKAKVRQLRYELKSAKKGNQTISEYVLRVKAIADSLLAIGDSISEQEQIDAVLEGLPEEYNNFVMMIYGRPDSPSPYDIEGLLLVQEAQRDKFRQELAITSVSANVAQSSQSHNSQFPQNRVDSSHSQKYQQYQ